MTAPTVLAWHFCSSNRKLNYGDGRPIIAGETLTVEGPPILCKCGLHASRSPLDALRLGWGLTVCRVRLSGAIVEGSDKLAATERKTLWVADASEAVTAWAFACADSAVRIHAPAALRSAGLGAEADKLASLPEIVDGQSASAAWAAWAASDARAARVARAARAASAAWAAWAASDASDASAAWAAWAASDASDASAAWATRAASDARVASAAWAASDAWVASAAWAARAAELRRQERDLSRRLMALRR